MISVTSIMAWQRHQRQHGAASINGSKISPWRGRWRTYRRRGGRQRKCSLRACSAYAASSRTTRSRIGRRGKGRAGGSSVLAARSNSMKKASGGVCARGRRRGTKMACTNISRASSHRAKTLIRRRSRQPCARAPATSPTWQLAAKSGAP